MSDNDLIRRGDVLREAHDLALDGMGMLDVHALEGRLIALPAAPTFTAADLERAWEMGRDEAARAVHEAGRMTLGHLNAIGGLTPPADLAQRVKGPAHD